MRVLIILLFPLCAFSQLPAGKYLKVKDDGTESDMDLSGVEFEIDL